MAYLDAGHKTAAHSPEASNPEFDAPAREVGLCVSRS